jgi:sugar phosphate isomerase/epimerase
MKLLRFLAPALASVVGIAAATAAPRPLYVYDFGGLEKLPPEERVDLAASAGYAGLVLSGASASDIENLPRHLARCSTPGGPRILAVFVRYSFIDTATDISRRETVVRQIAGRDIALWIILDNKRPGITTAEAEAALTAAARDAAEHHVPIALYPHSRCFVSSAEEALTIITQIDRPELSIVLHLCHERRAHNDGRLAEVVRKVGSRVSAISISGGAAEVDFTTPGTMDRTTIRPLDESAFDWAGFIAMTDAAGLRVPVAFINFKIPAPVTDYLPRSLAAWRRATGS